MENQTRFNLNAAVENWRNELAAQPNLASDDRRELETHLRDTISELRQRGLNDEESFVLARHRIGKPQKLADEFVKENPAKIWRERVFWLVFGLLIYRLWNTLASSAITPLYTWSNFHGAQRLEDLLPQWVLFYFPIWLRDLHYGPFLFIFLEFINTLLVLTVVICLVRGKLEKLRSILEFAFKNRLRFVLVAMLSVMLVSVVGNFIWNSLCVEQLRGVYVGICLYNAFWSSWIIAIVVWLLPTQNQKIPKRI
ncbi:MAG TPA: permease prefix domain 1-containing protein [Verrucomicrobiae bacterium]|nr:permease prefix domain 1-containing protein [Verrucomicrobiae bacterium]